MDVCDLIKSNEGFRSQAYMDATGNLTIGYGTNLHSGLTEFEAATLLNSRISELIDDMTDTWVWFKSLDPVRSAVLVDMAYNLGLPGLHKFNCMLDHISKGEWDLAADDMLTSHYAQQLPKRAGNNAELMRTGTWTTPKP